MVQFAAAAEGMTSPLEIIRELDQFVIGQDEAKRALALAGYRHYLGLRLGRRGGEARFGKQHVLLTGPTGCGKTRLVSQLGRIFDRPMATVAATSLVESGYTGEHVESAVGRLVLAANGDVMTAESGILFIDEVDKIRRSEGIGKDVSGEGVQHALLKLLDGMKVPVRQGDGKVMVDTRRMFFVFAGAFEGLDEIARRRTAGPDGIGFGRSQEVSVEEPARMPVEDLIEYGLVREFVGRFSAIASVRHLDAGQMKRHPN